LRVEQDEQAGEAVGGFDGVVVQQPAGLLPPSLGVYGAGRALPLGCRELQAGQLLPAGPAYEVPGFATMSGPVADPGGAPIDR
jgi:hypothetical protein